MQVQQIPVISLGVVKRAGGVTREGKSYEGYEVLNFVVEGENNSRKFYFPSDNPTLCNTLRRLGDTWGMNFFISGDVDDKGRITIEDATTEP